MEFKRISTLWTKKYAQALDAVNKAIESDKTYGMAWYNKACFLSLLNQVPESLQALKHAIEIDVKNDKKIQLEIKI